MGCHARTAAYCHAAAVMLVAAACWGAYPACAWASDWLSGSRLQSQLQQPPRLLWSENPLRRALHNLSHARTAAIFIDRRLDPDQKLTLSSGEASLAETFRQIAESRKFGYCQFGPVAYFGPSEVTARLRTIATLRREELRSLPPAIAKKFLRTKRLTWEDFATPRELLDLLAGENGFQIVGLDRIPHDLWAEADLPSLPLVDRITLLAAQFDLTFRISNDGKTVSLIDAPPEPVLVRSYSGGPLAAKTAERWAGLVPDAHIKVVGQKIYLTGRLEDHEKITRPRQPVKKPPTRDFKRDRFSLTLENMPLDKLLGALARQLNLELRMDRKAIEAAGLSLDQNISLKVKEVTIDELFRAALKSTGLSYSRRGSVVEITPAQ